MMNPVVTLNVSTGTSNPKPTGSVAVVHVTDRIDNGPIPSNNHNSIIPGPVKTSNDNNGYGNSIMVNKICFPASTSFATSVVETFEKQDVLETPKIMMMESELSNPSNNVYRTRTCIICSSRECVQNWELDEAFRINLLQFCQLVKINIPTRSRASLVSFSTPLCLACLENVRRVKALVKQLETLQRDIFISCNVIKQKIAEKVDETCDMTKLTKDFPDLYSAIAFIRNSIRIAVSNPPTKKTTNSASKRKPMGRKPVSKVVKSRNQAIKKRLASVRKTPSKSKEIGGKEGPATPSHRTSFGRVVKRPRHLISDTESENEIVKSKKRRDCKSIPMRVKSISPIKCKPLSEPVKLGNEKQSSYEADAACNVGPSNNSANHACVNEESQGHASILKQREELRQNKKGKTKVTSLGNQESSLILKQVVNFSEPNEKVSAKDMPLNQGLEKEYKARSQSSKKKGKALHRGAEEKKVVSVNKTDPLDQDPEKPPLKQDVQKKTKTPKQSTQKKTESSETKVVDRIKCEKCIRTFIDVRKKEEHFRRFHEGKKRMFACKLCPKQFLKLRDLFHHKKTEHPVPDLKFDTDGRRIFQCEFCNIVFRNYSDLQIHRRKHTGETPFKCELCHEGFISKGKYELHIESSHSEIPPLKCEFCSRGFFRHHRLRDHKTSHTGERPYQCEVCGQSFGHPSYLKYHQTKHKELNLEEFKCDQCERKFASPVNLKLHRETQHQKKYRYHCSICGHGSSHISHLKLHMRSHTGERPFSCSLCTKTFSRGSQLKIHMRNHTGERPYVCKTCSKSFTNNSKLRRHELTHAPNRPKRRNDIIKVTPLEEEVEVADLNNAVQKHETIETPMTAATTIIIPEITEENGQQFLKLEQFGPATIDENDSRPILTIEQPDGITYQVIATNDVVDPYTEYVVLNGDFTIS